jgi:hypothetical protein
MTTRPIVGAPLEKLAALVGAAAFSPTERSCAAAVLATLPEHATIVDFLRALDASGARALGRKIEEAFVARNRPSEPQ